MTTFANFGQRFFKNKDGELIGVTLGHSYSFSHEHGLSFRLRFNLESDHEKCMDPETFVQIEKDGILYWFCSVFTTDCSKAMQDVTAYFEEKKKSSWALNTEPYADREFETLWDQNTILIRFKPQDNEAVKKLYIKLIEDGLIIEHPEHRIVFCVGEEMENTFV